MNTISGFAGNGTIGYVEYSYPLNKDYPVVKVLNKGGYYVEPTQYNVAVALTKAQINKDTSSQLYLTQILDGVYSATRPAGLPAVVLQLHDHPDRRERPADDDRQAADARPTSCTTRCARARPRPAPYGYSPLPLNLVQAGFDAARQAQDGRPGGRPRPNRDVDQVQQPDLRRRATSSKNKLAEIAPQPAACDKVGRGPVRHRRPAPASRRPTTRSADRHRAASTARRPAGRRRAAPTGDGRRPATTGRSTGRRPATAVDPAPASRRPTAAVADADRAGRRRTRSTPTPFELSAGRRWTASRLRLARGARAARPDPGARRPDAARAPHAERPDDGRPDRSPRSLLAVAAFAAARRRLRRSPPVPPRRPRATTARRRTPQTKHLTRDAPSSTGADRRDRRARRHRHGRPHHRASAVASGSTSAGPARSPTRRPRRQPVRRERAQPGVPGRHPAVPRRRRPAPARGQAAHAGDLLDLDPPAALAGRPTTPAPCGATTCYGDGRRPRARSPASDPIPRGVHRRRRRSRPTSRRSSPPTAPSTPPARPRPCRPRPPSARPSRRPRWRRSPTSTATGRCSSRCAPPSRTSRSAAPTRWPARSWSIPIMGI